MHLLATPFTLLEIIVFIVALIAFGLAVRFFIASQKKLEGLLPDRKSRRAYFGIGIDRDGFLVPTNRQKVVKGSRADAPASEETKSEIKELRQMLQLQQLELNRALRKIEDVNAAKNEEVFADEDRYEEEDEDFSSTREEFEAMELRQQLARQEAELRELRQQAELNSQLEIQFEEMQNSYADLQQEVQKMEQQAWEAAETAIKLSSLEQELEQQENILRKKEEKLLELTAENGRLHQLLSQSEDKLSDVNLQRQQLVKKLRLLEEMNTDIQQMSDSNRRLKTELRRVGELESMLNLITEERDALLKRRRL